MLTNVLNVLVMETDWILIYVNVMLDIMTMDHLQVVNLVHIDVFLVKKMQLNVLIVQKIDQIPQNANVQELLMMMDILQNVKTAHTNAKNVLIPQITVQFVHQTELKNQNVVVMMDFIQLMDKLNVNLAT